MIGRMALLTTVGVAAFAAAPAALGASSGKTRKVSVNDN